MKANSNAPGSARGFSLLELLLVLVVVGLIATLAALSVGSGSRRINMDAAVGQFADIAAYALEQAEFSGIDMGLLLSVEGGRYRYQWLQRNPIALDSPVLGWLPAPFDEDAYGPRFLPEGLEPRLAVEQTEVPLPAAAEEAPPQVVFFASGETTPGAITWLDAESGEVLWETEWDLLGRISTVSARSGGQ